MRRTCALAILAGILGGCFLPDAARRREIEWPAPDQTPLVMPSVEAGAAIAAAAAVREMIKRNPFPDLFWGCSSPEQGLNVATFKDSKTGLYFVVVQQRFNRCGGPSGRVLDGWYEYAVTPQGEVLAEAPPPSAADFSSPAPVNPPPHPEKPSSSGQAPAPDAPPATPSTAPPEPTAPPAPGSSVPPQTVPPLPSPSPQPLSGVAPSPDVAGERLTVPHTGPAGAT